MQSAEIEDITRRLVAALATEPSSEPPCLAAAAGNACAVCAPVANPHVARVRQNIVVGAEARARAARADGASRELAPFIDHTLLKAEASRDDLARVCAEAKEYAFATVCVNASNLRFVATQLNGTTCKPIAVVGFPLGAMTTHAKAYETKDAIHCGAAEVDMVIDIGALKSKSYALVVRDIAAVVNEAGAVPVKVIIEAGALSDEEKIIACSLAKLAGAAFVKTSTGFGPGGATVQDIALMRQVVGEDMGVKASGGVRTTDDARQLIAAGASRLGASASVAIVTGSSSVSGTY
jgi:deoxyribose-phosphate aldolase